jgi:flagellar hook-associated protein 1 FlgK
VLGASSALQAFQYALTATQNNIDNASTPGYANQAVALQADPFDPALGLTGGVSQGPLVDSRDPLAESDVWQQASAQGDASAQSNALTTIQNAMPVSDGSGIPAALTTFFSDISAWSASPTNGSAQQNVMLAANSLAQSFQTTSAAVASASQSVSQSVDSTVGQINQLTQQIATLNAGIQNGGQHDAGMQAQVYSALETLSGLVNIGVLRQSDGSVDVTLSSGAALVMGSNSYALSPAPANNTATDPLAPPDMYIQAADGTVVNGQITSGSLAGLLQVQNVTIPGLLGDATHTGALNQLASTIADQVNAVVSAGLVSPGPPAVPAPSGLFTYNGSSPTLSGAAGTFAVDPNMTASQLPAYDPTGTVSNGVPLAVAALANATLPGLGGASCTTFYGNAAASVGAQLNQAQSNQTMTAQTLAQAQNMRQTESGVSLDAEAINVLQFQAAYQAVAKMVTTLATLTQSLIDMIPS